MWWGILFLLELIPNAMGGGDIKFMFALGSFLENTGLLFETPKIEFYFK